jgi:hypothetical protein
MPDYSKGKIYKLVCGDLTYIGSTIQSLAKRKGGHKVAYKKYKYENSKIYYTSFQLFELDEPNDYKNIDIILIENCPCENREQLIRRERFHIENTECVNKNIPISTRSEIKQRWREKNREKVNKYARIYNKKYREENGERIRERGRKYYEKNREKELERGRKYYEKNKEKIIRRQRERRQLKKNS